MAMSSLWNVVVVGFVVEACLNSDRTVEAMNDIRMLAPKLSWAVAPAIGYFFGKPQPASDIAEMLRTLTPEAVSGVAAMHQAFGVTGMVDDTGSVGARP